MEQLRYPVGMQTFSQIIEEGYAYVDKTAYIKPLLKQGKFIFLSRPRRFGKSLLLSTLKAYFEGRRDLFKGLAADKMDLDWNPSPVLYFDFNSGLYSQPNGLAERIETDLTWMETQYGVPSESDKNIVTRFGNLIRSISLKTQKRVVILVDEYDKPLLDLDDNPELFEKNQSLLKGFFSNLKSMDAQIKFCMLTGVARFSKVSIFSDLNNLDDISMYEDYQEICGWTENELVDNFRSGIEVLAKEREQDFDTTLNELRNYYDGYLFSKKGSRLYNPFSVLKALKSRQIEPYWFETGTPTFLAKRIKKFGIDPASLNEQHQSYNNLISAGIGSDDVVALMFQTGYLTIKSYDSRRQRYTLGFPNHEVEVGFAQNLLPLYAPSTKKINSPFNLERFKDDLYEGNPEDFMKRLDTLFKDLPGEDHKESTYRALTYLLCILSDTEAQPERHSYNGRSDLEVLTTDYVYLFEFKYNKSVSEAMAQIYARDYAGRYAMDARTIYLIGANFNEKKADRALQYKIEKLSPHFKL